MRIEASKEGSNAGRFAGGQDVENENEDERENDREGHTFGDHPYIRGGHPSRSPFREGSSNELTNP
jgi:hypothetical protein